MRPGCGLLALAGHLPIWRDNASRRAGVTTVSFGSFDGLGTMRPSGLHQGGPSTLDGTPQYTIGLRNFRARQFYWLQLFWKFFREFRSAARPLL